MSLSGGTAPEPSHTGTAAGGRPSGSPGSPDGAAAKTRARRQKSDAQRQKSGEKLQHKWLQRRCEAAATKTGGLPPKILGRVLACCGRFLELLDPEGAEMMERLRQAEAQSVAPMDATEWVSEPSGGWLKAAQAASRGPPKKKKAASRSGTQDAKLGTVFQFGTQAAEPGTVFRFGQNAPT